MIAPVRERDIEIELTDDARTLIGNLGYDPTYGARPLKRVIQKRLVDPLALAILEGRFVAGDTVRVDAADGELVLERAPRPPRLRRAAGADDRRGRAAAISGTSRRSTSTRRRARCRPTSCSRRSPPKGADDQEQPGADPRGQPRGRAARRDGQGAVGDARPVRLRQRDRGARRADDRARLARARLARDRPVRDADARSRSTTSSARSSG